MNDDFIYPDWPAPSNIKALSTSRIGGNSLTSYASFNLAEHVGDNIDTVQQNRAKLIEAAQLPTSPYWLNQTHSTHIINSSDWRQGINADAMFSTTDNHICTIMTADCLPILLCDTQGTMVAAIHAGWRGLAAGIIEKTISKFSAKKNDIMAWLGPAIGPTQFEVGEDVYKAFTSPSPQAHHAFKHTDDTHYLADIYLLAPEHVFYRCQVSLFPSIADLYFFESPEGAL